MLALIPASRVIFDVVADYENVTSRMNSFRRSAVGVLGGFQGIRGSHEVSDCLDDFGGPLRRCIMTSAFDNLQSCAGYSGGKCRLMFTRKLKVVTAGHHQGGHYVILERAELLALVEAEFAAATPLRRRATARRPTRSHRCRWAPPQSPQA